MMYGSNSTVSSFWASGETSLHGEYDVFLNFCGKDTRYGFTDYLYRDLQDAGILTFRDDKELPEGEKIRPELEKAIMNSKIYITIFSEKYASSRWCMLELAEIVKCHAEAQGEKMIFPIFYDVEPHDVKHQSGSYAAAFRQHEENMRLEVQTVQSWRAALTMVGEIKGLELKKQTGGHEGELVKLAVKKCLQVLRTRYQLIPENLVGMEPHIRNLEGLLNIEANEVRIVGIYGMGGIGKTTMAKVIYNRILKHFDGHCFLENVREKSTPPQKIVDLQNQLISQIQNKEVSGSGNSIDESKRVKEAVRGKKVLIILDDVDKKFHIDKLMGNESWLSVQSRVIITTRDSSVLDKIGTACRRKDLVYSYASYKPDILDDHHSLQLFSKFAFKRDSPFDEYYILSKEVAEIAAGLPLVLKVLGSTFYGVECANEWKEMVKKLRRIPIKEVIDVLRFSFDTLEDAEQEMFLDIACFFIGKNVENSIYMWEDLNFFPSVGINVLIKRSLITISENTFVMHDQLRDLGRHVVHEGVTEGKLSRYWCEEDGAIRMLETSEDANCVKSIYIPSNEFPKLLQSSTSLLGLVLSLLRPPTFLFPHLREDLLPLEVSNFPSLPNLRFLSLKGYNLCGHFKHPLSNLRWLELTCLGNFMTNNLHLKYLVILDLSSSILTDDWEGWRQLEDGRLKLLDLSACHYLEKVPGLSTFSTLEKLIIRDCCRLKTLDGVQKLNFLKYLDATLCPNLQAFPKLSNLTNLVELKLSCCNKMTEVDLEYLESLVYLDVRGCGALKSLRLSKLEKFKTLKAGLCENLTEIWGLEGLKSLENIEICNFKLIRTLPNISNLKKLKGLDASCCTKVYKISGLEDLTCLESLDIHECKLIETLPNLSKLENLRKLDASGCGEITAILGLEKLKFLEDLKIARCKLLEAVPTLSKLDNLKWLDVSGCKKLTAMPGLGELKSLEELNISGCELLESIPNLSQLQKLTKLDASGCVTLTKIGGVEKLLSLQVLDISRCISMEILPDLSALENLQKLDVAN